MQSPDQAPAPEVSLSRQEKEKLLQHMYSLPHWIAIIRLFGYKTLNMDRARQEIKPIAEEYGKEPVANACEALVEIRVQDKEAFAKLKPHIRRMAFQILGPEPTPGTGSPAPTDPERPNPEQNKARASEKEPRRERSRKGRPKGK